MNNTNDIEVLFVGSKIRIDKSKTSGYIYFQTIDNSMPSGGFGIDLNLHII